MHEMDEIEIDRPEGDGSGIEPPAEPPRGGGGTLVVALLLFALIAAGGWWLLQRPAPAPVAPPETTPAPAATESEPPPPPAPADPPLVLPPLAASDALVRELAARLSSHPQLAAWLLPDELVRRAAAALVNVAEGESPASHLDFLAPAGRFAVVERGGEIRLDPASYRRYDLLTDLFVSLDTEGTARLYRQLRPLCDEAIRELGYPGGRCDDFLARATGRLLRVPHLDPPPALTPRVVSYAYADPELEALSPAARHLLRCGPDNSRRIQEKLRALAAAVPVTPR